MPQTGLGGLGSRVRESVRPTKTVEPRGNNLLRQNATAADLLQSFNVSSENLNDDVTALVQHILFGGQQRPKFAVDSPVMQLGLTSASAVQFRNQLSTVLPEVSMPAVFVFDFPTIAEISREIVSGLGPRGLTLLATGDRASAHVQSSDVESANSIALARGSTRA
jgi:hypothetical protein